MDEDRDWYDYFSDVDVCHHTLNECRSCRALIADGAIWEHVAWHESLEEEA